MKKLKNNYRFRIKALYQLNRIVIASALTLSFLSLTHSTSLASFFLSSADAATNETAPRFQPRFQLNKIPPHALRGKNKIPSRRFQLEEASIQDIHNAIRKKETTCKGIVQAYINRAAAYNGVCTRLVTQDGAPIQQAFGAVRAGKPLKFPTSTIAASGILPNLNKYAGLPLDLGRMEPTISDPSVMQQYGMRSGIPNAGQLNALETLNIRGERSVACKATCDRPASESLPASCPAACESFRQQPDALEQAAELDALYGSNPPLDKLPMYCITFSFKDSFDTKDMRTTASADVNYALDFPPEDSTAVEELRAKGAIILAKAVSADYNAGSGNPGGNNTSTSNFYGVGSSSSWAGTPCNAYDTERETGGSSSGSPGSVAANLVMCSFCEETGGSCRQPAWRQAVVSLMTTKSINPYGGAIGATPYVDRPGIMCRTVRDAALTLDALRNPLTDYFDPRDIYTALPTRTIPDRPYETFVLGESDIAGKKKPLAGMRIALVREFMVKHSPNDADISDRISEEAKFVIRDQLGAKLVESFDPQYPDDPDIPNMAYTFQDALAEVIPDLMPEYFFKTNNSGELLFAVDGFDVRTVDYLVKLGAGDAPLSDALNLRRIQSYPSDRSFAFDLGRYLHLRKDERVFDWATLNANSKHVSDGRRAAMANWGLVTDLRSEGITERIKMREVQRIAILKVMRQNKIDLFINPTITIPQAKQGGASQPTVNNRPGGRFALSADLGIPEITVPAGFTKVVYEPEFRLNATGTAYTSVAGSIKSTLPKPMPFGMSFWAGPGDEPALLTAASAYEVATKHRVPPPDFGPLK
jgi:amidase